MGEIGMAAYMKQALRVLFQNIFHCIGQPRPLQEMTPAKSGKIPQQETNIFGKVDFCRCSYSSRLRKNGR